MSLLLMTSYDSSKGVFTPTSIAGLQLWLKADSLVLSDNDPVGTWEDSAGSNDATQAVAGNKPTYKTNIINGKPVVRCDGSDIMALTSPISLAGAYTLYAVGKRAASNTWVPIAKDTNAGLTIFNDNIIYIVDDAGVFPSVPYTGSTGNIITRWHRSAVGSTNKFRSTGMSETNVGINGAMTINRILTRLTGLNYTIGDFGEILLWNVDLTAPQMTQVETYLNAKWGVAL